MTKTRKVETDHGIQGEVDVHCYDVMQRHLRNKGWIETDELVRYGSLCEWLNFPGAFDQIHRVPKSGGRFFFRDLRRSFDSSELAAPMPKQISSVSRSPGKNHRRYNDYDA